MSERRRIVIIGGGFAGISAARALERRLDVTLVDKTPWLEILPNIHELVSGVKRPEDLRLPRQRLLERAGHRFLEAEVMAIDTAAHRVELAGGRTLPYDHLVMAIGGKDETFGVEGVDQHALRFKSVDQCQAIGEALRRLVEAGGRASVVIVGGGLEGVEALGEILRRYRRRRPLEVTLVEAADRLLPTISPAVDRAIRDHCRHQPVTIRTGLEVSRLESNRVVLEGGESLESDLTIWTGGVRPPALLHEAGLAPERGRWAPVAPTLRSTRTSGEVWIIGDAAGLTPALSKQAYHAQDMGTRCAENIERVLDQRPPRPFRPSPKPMLIAFGDLDTFMVASDDLVLASPALASAKEGVYHLVMGELDPPSNRRGLRATAHRLKQSATELALPTLTSLSSLRRLPEVRLLR